jgi:hypothetical protein
MLRSESISTAVSSVNGRTRGALDRKARVNGTSITEKIRTKNGKVTKAQMRKTATALSPEALYFFRDELEKQAVLTPASAMKAIQSPNRVIQALGRGGLKAQDYAMRAAPTLNRMGMQAASGPGAVLGAAAEDATKALMQRRGFKPGTSSFTGKLVGNVVGAL